MIISLLCIWITRLCLLFSSHRQLTVRPFSFYLIVSSVVESSLSLVNLSFDSINWFPVSSSLSITLLPFEHFYKSDEIPIDKANIRKEIAPIQSVWRPFLSVFHWRRSVNRVYSAALQSFPSSCSSCFQQCSNNDRNRARIELVVCKKRETNLQTNSPFWTFFNFPRQTVKEPFC